MIANSFRRSFEFVDKLTRKVNAKTDMTHSHVTYPALAIIPSITCEQQILRTMAVLESLPDELFAQILEDLSDSDLASTLLVCRRLRNISQPLLYREPHLQITDQHPTSFDLFLGTLFTPGCESLGTHARCLTIDWKSHDIRHGVPDLPVLAAARAHFMLGHTPFSDISQVVLLVQLMPRLQALHLPRLHESGNISVWPRPLHLKVLPPTLRDFTYQWPAPTNLIGLENLLAILRLPRIRSLVVHQMSMNIYTEAGKTLLASAAGTSSLTHLTIRCDSTPLQELQSILRIPCALTHLVYQPFLLYAGVNFAAVGLALLPLQHSLTTLFLDLRFSWPLWRTPRSTTSIGSLRDWPALQTVTCTLGVLIASGSHGLAAVLPAGIRELDILEDEDMPVGEAVKEVVALLAAADMVPALERVRVYAGRRKSKSLRRRLRKACWAVGVAFEDGLIYERPGWMNQ